MRKKLTTILVAMLALAPAEAFAHPHVFVEANLEILRDADGAVIELRHVWRFDELFSSTVLLDFDADGDGKLNDQELEEVSATVTELLGEYDFYTEIRLDGQSQDFVPPPKIMVDYQDNQILMFFAETMEPALPIAGKAFRVAVSDPTYYVAVEIANQSSVQITGKGEPCDVAIERPDFDKLYAQNSQTLTEQFFNNPTNAALGDQWLTWIDFKCGQAAR